MVPWRACKDVGDEIGESSLVVHAITHRQGGYGGDFNPVDQLEENRERELGLDRRETG